MNQALINGLKQRPTKWQVISITLWLSFLLAGIATGIFFSLVDPESLGSCVRLPEISRMAAYSIGFFLFWLLTFLSGYITQSFLTVEDP